MNPNEAWSKQSMTAAMQLSTLQPRYVLYICTYVMICKARRQLYDACSIVVYHSWACVFIDHNWGSFLKEVQALD